MRFSLIDKILRTVHRISGTFLSLLFLMWFLTGIVMMYHKFPSASREEKMSKMEPLRDSLPSLKTVLEKEGLSSDSLRSASIYRYLGTTCYDFGKSVVKVDSSESYTLSDNQYIAKVVSLWCSSDVKKVDTLNRLEQWIPFGRLKADFPIYKYYFADNDNTQLYISSKSKEVLQCTTRSERIWAWFGAIPHWVYFTWLRQDVETWKEVIIWLSIVGMIMLLSGLWLAIRSFRISCKQGRGVRSPYKKRWYRWHHVFGTVFGLFLFTWIMSGMYSLTKIPDWLGREHQKYEPWFKMNAGLADLDSYTLDLNTVREAYKDSLIRMEYGRFYKEPYYKLLTKGGEELFVSASATVVKPFYADSSLVRAAVEDIHKGEKVTISLMTEYDNYYIDLKGKMALPVWKAEVQNKDHSRYYVNPVNGSVRGINRHSKWQFQLYQGLHSLRYKLFVGHHALWTVVMWALLLAGAFVSLTGVVLGVRYVIRLFRRKR